MGPFGLRTRLRGARTRGLARPVHTNRFDAAPFAATDIAPRRAALEHAHVTQREVVPGGIARIQPSEGLGDLRRRAKRKTRARRKAQVSAKLVDVDVDRDQEPGRVEIPQAKIDSVRRPHHPPEKKEQALAPGAATGVGQKMGWATPRASRDQTTGHAYGVAPSAQGQAHGLVRRSFAGKPVARELAPEPCAERPVGSLNGPRAHEQASDVFATKNAVLPTPQTLDDGPAIVCEPRRMGAQALEEIFELGANGLDVAERYTSRDESHELSIVDGGEAMREAHGVRRAALGHVAAGSDSIERRLDGDFTTAQTGAHGSTSPAAWDFAGARFSAASRARCA